jgi:carbonic anhydrase
MRSLIAGYRKFRKEVWPGQRAHFAELAKGQKPHSLIISCSDSRVDPVTIFGADPGELFVMRNVASIVPPYETGGGHHGVSAAIAFAVLILEVERIVVLGHAQCGGIEAAMKGGASKEPFVGDWVALLEPAVQRCGHRDHRAVEHESIRLSLARLRTFPFVAERANRGRLELAGAHFGIMDGTLSLLDPDSNEFRPVDIAGGA